MEGHTENVLVGRGEGFDWIVKQTFETKAEMKAYRPSSAVEMCGLQVFGGCRRWSAVRFKDVGRVS